MRGTRVVQLLEFDPSLGEGLTAEELAVASGSLPVQAVALGEGPWRPSLESQLPGHLGYLVVSGLLVRRVEVSGGASAELLGAGDLLRPWQEEASSFCAATWEVLEAVKMVPLGPPVAQALARWPAMASNLIARGVRRSRMAVAVAAIASIVGVQERLLVLLWQLAETWGEVGEDGVRLPLRLPHRLLAELVGARRPSVTSALSELQQGGRLAVAPDGCWVLRGDPPG